MSSLYDTEVVRVGSDIEFHLKMNMEVLLGHADIITQSQTDLRAPPTDTQTGDHPRYTRGIQGQSLPSPLQDRIGSISNTIWRWFYRYLRVSDAHSNATHMN